MISFIRGKKIHIDPAKIIIEVNGIGYDINISLRTYSKLKDESDVFVYTHVNVKEDSHTLYVFNSESERNTFLSLLSINGVGPSTAIMILSSLSANELKKAKGYLKGAFTLEHEDSVNISDYNGTTVLLDKRYLVPIKQLYRLRYESITKDIVNNVISKYMSISKNKISTFIN